MRRLPQQNPLFRSQIHLVAGLDVDCAVEFVELLLLIKTRLGIKKV
jgi:hypothetical protein